MKGKWNDQVEDWDIGNEEQGWGMKNKGGE